MDMRKLPLTLSVEEAGELIGISRRSAYRAVAAGHLPTLRVGRRVLIPTAKLLALLGIENAPVEDLGIERYRTEDSQ